MMISYKDTEVAQRVIDARRQGIKLGRKRGDGSDSFLATSSQTGEYEYRVLVGRLGDTMAAASCSCPAGQKGMQCKHGAAAIKAARDRQVSNAARILRQHRARVAV